MQGVDAIDDLLQRAVRDDARQNDVAATDRRGNPAGAEPADDAFVRRDARGLAASTKGAAELISVPALPRSEDRYYGVSTPVSAVNPPLANFGMSSATALKPGVEVPFLSASIEENVSSAFR